jgi:hypothetical protein
MMVRNMSINAYHTVMILLLWGICSLRPHPLVGSELKDSYISILRTHTGWWYVKSNPFRSPHGLAGSRASPASAFRTLFYNFF